MINNIILHSKKFYILFFIFIGIKLLFASNFTNDKVISQIDALDYSGEYKEALDLALKILSKHKTDLRIVWRIGMETLEVSNQAKDTNTKLKIINYPLTILDQYRNINYGNNKDRSLILYWYTVLYATKIKLKGLFAGREAFSIVPNVFKFLDRCLELDPNNYSVFFFLGKFYADLPRFMGGDKIKSELFYIKAIQKANSDEVNIFKFDFALSLLKRNWNIGKKQDKIKKLLPTLTKEEIQILTKNKDDKNYTREILLSIIANYQKRKSHSLREKEVYEKTRLLLKSLQ